MDLSSMRDRQFEELLRDGITAAKGGQRKLAQSLLNRATMVNPGDGRPYVWLSATTDDPKEQIDYLEKAVALDPSNVAARRGLAILTGKIDGFRLMKEGADLTDASPKVDSAAQSRTFQCPQCGGRMGYSVSAGKLACEYCGFTQPIPTGDGKPAGGGPVADRVEQVLDFVMPTTRGHLWAKDRHQMACEKCGAVSLVQPGHKALQCSYCGSNQLVETVEQGELVEPHAIAVMKLDMKQAMQRVKEWLGRGLFVPDDLLVASQGVRLRPAYYSCWVFDGTVEVRWNCEVKVGSGNSQRWEGRNGVHAEFFKDVLVSGVKALKENELASAEPFNLVDLEEFKPDYLAGWPAIIYDLSLADASLVGREKVIRKLRPLLFSLIEIGQEKRNLNIGGGSWSGMTFKHVLLPVWIGTYLFKGKEFHLLVNGQTGKVGGIKPRDNVKMVLGLLTLVFLVVLLIAVIWLLIGTGQLIMP